MPLGKGVRLICGMLTKKVGTTVMHRHKRKAFVLVDGALYNELEDLNFVFISSTGLNDLCLCISVSLVVKWGAKMLICFVRYSELI